ncbi:MAG: gluconolactonase [Planctomycetales bacterium]|nr:gluconolactonase [Planctomycetales bacterium]
MSNAMLRPHLCAIFLRCFFLVSTCGLGIILTQDALSQEEENYSTSTDSERQEGVPVGKIEGPFDLESNVFPGTKRQYWIYVPAQYEPEKAACTLIVQDGLKRAEGWKLPIVCDNLIHAKQMPVTIGIFVTPGEVPPAVGQAESRYNRSFEYDSLGGDYARFLLEELIPAVSSSYNLSTDPNDRMLAGSSSGAICAFNAAWERPDAFRRVFSSVGTYVGLRGANELATLVRKMEPKPLRVFLQDGSRDLNIYAGDWWIANQALLSSLTWAGYDVNHIWGEGGHNAKHSTAIMPEALRWLWRDYPQPISVGSSPVERRIDMLVPNVGWQEVSSGHEYAGAPACNAAGELFFCDPKAGRIYRVGEDGKTRIFADQIGNIGSMAFGPNGKLYGCRDGKHFVSFDTEAKEETLLSNCTCEAFVAMPNGIYYSDPSSRSLWYCDYAGMTKKVMANSEPVSALCPTVDHAFMHIVSAQQPFTYHAQIGTTGLLEFKQPYGYLHMPYQQSQSGARAIVSNFENHSLVATKIGVQVLDQLGRVNLILRNPSVETVNGMAFGGSGKDTLFVTAGGSVFKRALKTQGRASFDAPVQPPKPGL